MTMFWAAVLKPFVAVALLCVAIPFVYLFHRFFPEGKVKRLLLRRW